MKPEARQHVMAVCAIALLTVFFLVLYLYINAAQNRYSSMRVRSLSHYTASVIDLWLTGHKEEAGFLGELVLNAVEEGVAREYLEELATRKHAGRRLALSIEGGELVLFDAKGTRMASPEAPHHTQWMDLFSRAPEDVSVVGPVPSLHGSGDDLLFLHGLRRRDGSRLGAFAICVPLAELAERAGKLYAFNVGGRQYYLVGPKGELLMSQRGAGDLTSIFDDPELRFLPDMMRGKEDGFSRETLQGEAFLIAAAGLSAVDWQIYLLSPYHYEFGIMPLLRGVFCAAWLCLSLFVLVLLYMVRRNDHYKVLSELDHLTGVGNRLAFEKALADLGARSQFPVCLLIMDVDGLKILNDNLGHEAGDALLRRVAVLLQRTLREGDMIYRIGGDEFAVLIRGTDYAAAQPMAERISIQAALMREKTAMPPIYISHGLAEARDHESMVSLFTRADEAMYSNKNLRREAAARAILHWVREHPEQEDRRHPLAQRGRAASDSRSEPPEFV